MTLYSEQIETLENKTLLVLDDDNSWRIRLSRAMTSRGFDVVSAKSIAEAQLIIATTPLGFASLDVRLDDGYGLDLVPKIREKNPECKIIMVTGYGNIASAVAAIKIGVLDYLPKPIDADQISHALLNHNFDDLDLPSDPMSANRVKWEHIQRVLVLCNHNVSETARRLKMHRRTLQRILQKRAPI